MNNADEEVSLAGHVNKFGTRIVIDRFGKCRWISPATFRSACAINVRSWPFDTQTCSLEFGSYTMTTTMLNISILMQKTRIADQYVTNGDWNIEDIDIRTQEKKYSCCDPPFSVISFHLTLSRKPYYYLLYIPTPCSVLCLLTLTSFLIPSHSGERIGFITTLLLAMTVYLLLVQEMLPETSEEFPLIGLLIIVVIIETAAILLLTVIVLRCFHKEGTPPQWLLKVLRLGDCVCVRTPRKVFVKGKEAGDLDDKVAQDNSELEATETQARWQSVSERLDVIFFFIFAITMIVTYSVLLRG
ncbi:neuronal acetylcholine receptor subunit alpha-7-like [Nematostella vectensis]|uniref:neuronal acetylcholine receptor subunit alpha-7-like n=1 Tax=Nematostella vectensis TaxID=45351 RepID=UPI0020777AB6|nr:neuronal acetylcholine receptor subunit alpha-7-like [Nematostella vectensis]